MTKAKGCIWQIAGVTECGPIRGNNEDAIASDVGIGTLVLADGMGGHNAGEVASGMVVKEVMGLLRARHQAHPAPNCDMLRDWLEKAAVHANQAVYEAAGENSAYESMGATLVAAVLIGEKVCIGHVGDSRAYMFRHGKLQQLTRDHTLFQTQIDLGLISIDQLIRGKNRSPLTRGMGIEETVAVDVGIFDFGSDDTLLISSDGLFDPVSETEIGELLAKPLPLTEIAQSLIDCAIARGGRDNVSVLLARHGRSAKEKGRKISWIRHILEAWKK